MRSNKFFKLSHILYRYFKRGERAHARAARAAHGGAAAVLIFRRAHWGGARRLYSCTDFSACALHGAGARAHASARAIFGCG